ncbi:MAG: rod-binding protein [Rhodospirillales bacterium]
MTMTPLSASATPISAPITKPAAAAGHGRSPEAERAALRKAAVDFEAVFLTEMLKPMFEGIEAEAPFGGGNSEDIWRSFQIDEFGKAIARSGGVGIAPVIYQELLQVQEAKGATS